MVYVPLATLLSIIPLLNALALKVVVDVIFKEALYRVELEVGSLPSVV